VDYQELLARLALKNEKLGFRSLSQMLLGSFAYAESINVKLSVPKKIYGPYFHHALSRARERERERERDYWRDVNVMTVYYADTLPPGNFSTHNARTPLEIEQLN